MVDVVEAWAPTGGGIRAWVEAKALALQAHGGARHVLVVPGPRTCVTRTEAGLTIQIRSPRIPGCPPYRFLLDHRGAARVLRRLGPHVVELGSQYRAGPLLEACREVPGLRISAFLHTDLAGAYVEPWGRRLFGTRIGARIARGVAGHVGETFRSADLALAATPGGVATLQAMGVASPHLLPLGVDLETFCPRAASRELGGRAEVRDRLGAEAGARLLVYLGRLDGEKRADLLVEAFRRARAAHPHLHLLLVGDGPMAREVPRWQAEIPGLHHRPWEPSRAVVASLLASSDAYVTAGPHETFGLSVLEAQACGLPVLGVRAGALAERVDEGCGWLAPPDDVEALAAAMGEMATLSKGVLEAHGRAGRARAVRGGGWEATFRRLFALYGLEEPADAGGEEGWSRAEARAVGLS